MLARPVRLDGDALIPWVCPFLVAAAILMPSITPLERATFSVAGLGMNLRVATYFAVAAVTGLAALWAISRMKHRPIWLVLMLAMLAWFTFTALLAHQSPVEWLPTIVRFALYFGAATVWYWLVRSISDQARIERTARILPLAFLAMAVVPAAAGLVEFIRGSAPIVNAAPRVSGSMPTHIVAYSLVLLVSAVATIGPAILLGRKRGALLRWAATAMLTALVFATYTRLTILLLAACGGAIAVLLPGSRRLRLARLGGAVAVGTVVILLAQSTFEARFRYAAPLSQVMNPYSSQGPDGTEPPGAGGWDPEVDDSIAFRIKITQQGVELLSQSPLIGQGPGSFDRLFEAATGRANVAAHDDLLLIAVETGVPGLALYLLVLASLAWALWPRRPTGIPQADALIVTALVALGAVNLGAMIHNPTYFVEIQLPIWILVGAALGLRERAEAVTAAPPRGRAAK